MSKLEMIKKMVAAEKKIEAETTKVRQEWEGKPLADFITNTDPEGNLTLLLPVLKITKAGGPEVYVEVPKFEGIHSRFSMSLRSRDGRPSEVTRYKTTDQYRNDVVKCYTTDEYTKAGDVMLHWSGLETLSTLDRLKDVAVARPNQAPVRKVKTLIAPAEA